MGKAKSVEQIVADVARAIAEAKKAENDNQPPVNINTGTMYGSQSVTNVVVQGDYIPGNKKGK
jgi:membrane carboxypeptidase/penicillin-binding protein PbpC